MKKTKKMYPYNLLEECGIDTESTDLPEDIEGVIYYLLYSRKKALHQRNADVVMDYYKNGVQQTVIAAKYDMTRQRVFDVLKGAVRYLSEPENRYLLMNGIKERKSGNENPDN